MKRIVVIGSSCSGKTTLSKALSKKLDIPHVELDSIYWLENWTEIERSKFNQIIDEKTDADKWVVDGNYNSSKDISWKKATHIIWLDLNLSVILLRFIKRSFKRAIFKEPLWNNNKEDLKNSYLLFLWIFKVYKRNKKEFQEMISSNSYPNAEFIKIKNPKQVYQLLST